MKWVNFTDSNTGQKSKIQVCRIQQVGMYINIDDGQNGFITINAMTLGNATDMIGQIYKLFEDNDEIKFDQPILYTPYAGETGGKA